MMRSLVRCVGTVCALAVFLAGACVLGCGPAPSSLPEPGPHAIAVTVRTEPVGANVSIDGAVVGTAPITVRLNPGPHRVRASMSGYHATPEARVQVGATEPRDVMLSLVASH